MGAHQRVSTAGNAHRVRHRRALLLLSLLAGAAVAIAVRSYFSAPEPRLPAENLRVPATTPLVEPDRPDLFQEPQMDDPPE